MKMHPDLGVSDDILLGQIPYVYAAPMSISNEGNCGVSDQPDLAWFLAAHRGQDWQSGGTYPGDQTSVSMASAIMVMHSSKSRAYSLPIQQTSSVELLCTCALI